MVSRYHFSGEFIAAPFDFEIDYESLHFSERPSGESSIRLSRLKASYAQIRGRKYIRYLIRYRNIRYDMESMSGSRPRHLMRSKIGTSATMPRDLTHEISFAYSASFWHERAPRIAATGFFSAERNAQHDEEEFRRASTTRNIKPTISRTLCFENGKFAPMIDLQARPPCHIAA
jgi:hypothetical protein